jgi:ABC-type sugar transport system substrate-binding protein
MDWKKPFRRGLVAACFGLAMAGVSAPTSDAAGTTADGKRLIRIAYVNDNIDETQNTILDAHKQRIKAINASRPDIFVEMDVYDSRASVDKQLSDIQDAILKKPDVMIYSPVDNVGSLPGAQAAHDAGIKLIDRRVSNPEPAIFDVAFIANNETRWADETVNWLKSILKAEPTKVLKVGAIYGQPAQTQQLIRIDAIKKLADEMPDRVKIVATAYGNWLTETAQNITDDWLQAHPDINYIAAANDIMAVGVANAVVAAGKKDAILISGVDTTDDGLKRIKAGTQDFDIGVPYEGYAEDIDVAVDLALGKSVPKVYVVNAINIVTRDTVDKYLKQRGLE